MHFMKQLEDYIPINDQEASDKQTILQLWQLCRESLFTRANTFAHFTSSGFLLNPTADQTLMIHHNLYQSWGWTGGHADGETDLLKVACREAREETGIKLATPQSTSIASIDILPVLPHVKKGSYVGTHLHLNAAYILTVDETQPLRHNPDENSGTAWIDCTEIFIRCKEPHMHKVYEKLLQRAGAWA